jgi:hypothetical protein
MRPSGCSYNDQSSDEGSKGGYISTSGKRCSKFRISIPHAKDGTVMVNDDQVTISCHLSDRDIVYRCLVEDASDSEGESSSSPLRSYLDSSSTRRKLFNSILPSKAVYRAGQGGRQNPSNNEC